MKLRPCGHYVLIKQDAIERKHKIGDLELEIVNPEDVDGHREQHAQTTGHIVAIGPSAWEAFRTVDRDGILRNGEPWAKVGDKVYFAKFCGSYVTDPSDNEKYYLLSDQDITVVVEE